MLKYLNNFLGCSITVGGEAIGSIEDFYFDDHHWTVRYFLVDTGDWLADRLVLLSPASLQELSSDLKAFPVNVSREQIEESPFIDKNVPVSREQEEKLAKYYGWPVYWTATAVQGDQPRWIIPPVPPVSGQRQVGQCEPVKVDPRLRSVSEVTGYFLHAEDGEVGHAEDFLATVDSWVIRYLVVDTGRWWPGKKILIAPRWIDDIDWSQMSIYVDMPRQRLLNSPEFNPALPMTPEYEKSLCDYYQRSESLY